MIRIEKHECECNNSFYRLLEGSQSIGAEKFLKIERKDSASLFECQSCHGYKWSH